ncbi:MAG TPA: AAC(3) family N-acetyltransferase, partial [Clostridia bacterium]|nr:AAC(3) family N-acetyltransferase [Clostridia bacterium]
GRPVCAHTSLSSFGWIEGGAAALVDAYLDEGCTLLVPAFVYTHMVPMPKDCVYIQNGRGDRADEDLDSEQVPLYDPASNEISSSLGAVPREVLSRPGRLRGMHPINALAAIGPLAEALIARQTYREVYGPYAAAAEMGGAIALMGVGLTRCTPIHWAEQCAGQTLFVRWSLTPDRQVVECSVGSCSEGFERFAPVVAPFERRYTVGKSLWRVLPLGESMAAVSGALRAKPDAAHCDNPDCPNCNDKAKGGLIRDPGQAKGR